MPGDDASSRHNDTAASCNEATKLLVELASTKDIDVSVWLNEDRESLQASDFVDKLKSLAVVAVIGEENETTKSIIDTATSGASLQQIFELCGAGVDDSGLPLINVTHFLDLCNYTRTVSSAILFPDMNGGLSMDMYLPKPEVSLQKVASLPAEDVPNEIEVAIDPESAAAIGTEPVSAAGPASKELSTSQSQGTRIGFTGPDVAPSNAEITTNRPSVVAVLADTTPAAQARAVPQTQSQLPQQVVASRQPSTTAALSSSSSRPRPSSADPRMRANASAAPPAALRRPAYSSATAPAADRTLAPAARKSLPAPAPTSALGGQPPSSARSLGRSRSTSGSRVSAAVSAVADLMMAASTDWHLASGLGGIDLGPHKGVFSPQRASRDRSGSSRSRMYTTSTSQSFSVAADLSARESAPFVEDCVRDAVRQADSYRLIRVQLGIVDACSAAPARGAGAPVQRGWLTVRDIQTAFFAAKVRLNDTQVVAFGQLLSAFAKTCRRHSTSSCSSSGATAGAGADGTPTSTKTAATRVQSLVSHLTATTPFPAASQPLPQGAAVAHPGHRINPEWLRLYLAHLRQAQRSSLSLSGGHPLGAAGAFFPTQSITRGVNAKTRRSLSGPPRNSGCTGIGSGIGSGSGVGGGLDSGSGISVSRSLVMGAGDSRAARQVSAGAGAGADAASVDRHFMDEFLMPMPWQEWLRSSVADGQKPSAKSSGFRKALAGKPHSLSKDDVSRILENHEILPAPALEAEIAYKVRCWVLDTNGRGDFAHVLSMRLREWEARRKAQLKAARAAVKISDAERAAARDAITSECVEVKTAEWRAAERMHAAVLKDLYWKYDAFLRESNYAHSKTWAEWLKWHREESKQQLDRFQVLDQGRARACAERVARKALVATLGDIEIKLLQLNECPPLRECGAELRRSLVALRKAAMEAGRAPSSTTTSTLTSTSTQGEGVTGCPSSPPKQTQTQTQTQGVRGPHMRARLLASQADFDRHLQAVQAPRPKDLPESVRLLARDVHQSYRDLLAKHGLAGAAAASAPLCAARVGGTTAVAAKTASKKVAVRAASSSGSSRNGSSSICSSSSSSPAKAKVSVVVSVPSVMRENDPEAAPAAAAEDATTIASTVAAAASATIATTSIAETTTDTATATASSSAVVDTSEAAVADQASAELRGTAAQQDEADSSSRPKDRYDEWKVRKSREHRERAELLRLREEQSSQERTAKKREAERAYKKWLKLQKKNKYISKADGKKHDVPPAVGCMHFQSWSRETDISEFYQEKDRQLFS